MKARLWGTRGSLSAAGAETVRYGGDTSSVELTTSSGAKLILDAGSGIRTLGPKCEEKQRIDILLSHLHMDHVQGLPFFSPLLDPDVEVHIWGPISTTRSLRDRLSRYLSPPLFPVRVRDLPNVEFHDVLPGEFDIDSVRVQADLVTHPGSTLGYRLTEDTRALSYIPDHEPALGTQRFPDHPSWTSGLALAEGADVLIHDAQYTDDEYAQRIGWGHTSLSHLAAYAEFAEVKRLVTFHHDPGHTDTMLDDFHAELNAMLDKVEMTPGTFSLSFDV
ncbi:MAG: MBL fold metallo-hydrolase [Actinomycetota bacterium]